ncbi:PI-PLC X domain-containing protein 1 [Cladobotryum mycophilum]|uniref:PI-PLC X domain-containing protein 1 n=1 Tax=Cladobotryum mycophilum TaxID=491253 RepID=A0ABR0S5Z8_9HYPO
MWILRPLLFAGAALAACNGHDELCSRKYSDLINIGTHNSAFAGKSIVNNQYDPITEQLNAGIRFLQAQTQDKNGTIEMCHTYCWELDAGPLTQYLQLVSDWVKGHPNDVVTLLLTNIDAIDISKFDVAFQQVGLKDLVFHPKGTLSKDQWPTLQQLIDAKTRLIVFMDYHTDSSKADYILDEFAYFWETPYGVTDSKFPTCAVDRPQNGDTNKLMGIMNHMLNYKIGDVVFPNQNDAAKTNSLASIQAQYGLCNSQHGTKPNVVLLDWASIGDAGKAQLVLNGLS